MIGKVERWIDEAGIGYLRARYRADKGGVREAQETEQRMARTGWAVVDVQSTDGKLSVGRSATKSLLGLGLLGMTGFGFLGTARNPGEIIVTFAKPLDVQAQEETVPETPTTSVAQEALIARVLAQQPELRTNFGSVVLNGSEPIDSITGGFAVRLFVTVGNREGRAWDGFELEAVFYRPRDGETVDGARQAFTAKLGSGETRAVEMSVHGLRAGDFGVLVGITRVRIGQAWT